MGFLHWYVLVCVLFPVGFAAGFGTYLLLRLAWRWLRDRFLPAVVLGVLAFVAEGLAQVPPTAQAHAHAAAAHVETLPLNDRFYTRYVSWAGVPPEKVEAWQRVWCGWQRFLSQEQEYLAPRPVPGTRGLLWCLDLRDYRWNEAAWATVQQRDYLFEIPLVTGDTAYRLRFYSGVYEDPLKLGGICLASDLFRRTAESLIDPSYYDLLYAGQRFKDVQWLEYRNKAGRIEHYGLQSKFADFPQNEKDLDDHFGVTLAAEQAKKAGFLNRWGSIVPGAGDNPKEGSYVSNNERFLQIETQAPGGVKWKTFDLRDNSAVDLLEDAPKFVKDELPKADGGRIFWTLPSGLYAKLLVDGKGKRVEIAPTNIVSGRIGGRNCDVRTAIGCVQCHVPEKGFLLGTNEVATTLKARVDRIFTDPYDSRVPRDKGRQYLAFYLKWEQKIEGWRTEFWFALNEAVNPPGCKPMSPADFAREFGAFAAWDDQPTTLEQAAREVGCSPERLAWACAMSGTTRLNLLVRGQSVPRRLWKGSLCREAVRLVRLQEAMAFPHLLLRYP